MKLINLAAAALLPLYAITAKVEARETGTLGPQEARVLQSCEALLKNPLSPADLQTLAAAARDTGTKPEIRRRSMAAYALALLLQGNTNAFARAAEIQRSSFPDSPQPLIRVTQADYSAVCAECGGKGVKPATCPACLGSGKCRACKGTGQGKSSAGATVKCSSCQEPGLCRMCAGLKTLEKPCPSCNGAGRVFKLGARVRANYDELLSGIAGQCRENAEFAAMFKAAVTERDPGLRISMLHSLTNRFRHRDDTAEARASLDKALAAKAQQDAARQERETRERHELEIAALRKLETSENIPGALSALRTYLRDNPGTHARMELQLLIENLEARLARRRLTRKALMGLGGLLGLLVLVMAIQPLLRRKPVYATGPLPGMDKLQTDNFTDPLKLTAQESRDRAHADESRPPSPEL